MGMAALFGVLLVVLCVWAEEPKLSPLASEIMSYKEGFLQRTANVRQQDPAFECAWRQGACKKRTVVLYPVA